MCVGRTNGRSHSFVLDFSFVSFLCIKTKKRKELKNILYWLEERRNSTDNCMLQVKLSTRAENKRIFNLLYKKSENSNVTQTINASFFQKLYAA
jgi:hypothetical protein